MNQSRPALFVLAFLMAAQAVMPVGATGMTAMPQAEPPIHLAQGDCYAIGQQVAAQNGGTLASATPQMRDGRQVCVIVVLVPGRDGQRPMRSEIVVPM